MRVTRLSRAIRAGLRTSSVLTLPYTINFTVRPDGILPGEFFAPSWVTSGGLAINTPTLGGELITDPSLEANYTAGLCDTFLVCTGGTPTQSSDVHSGAKAQAWAPAADGDAIILQLTPVAKSWYLASEWVKRTSGIGGDIIANLYQVTSNNPTPITEAVYTQKKIPIYVNTAALLSFQSVIQLDATITDAVLVDDLSLKKIDASTLFALINGGLSDLTVKSRTTLFNRNSYTGLIAKADSNNPSSYLIAYYCNYYTGSWAMVKLDKVVNGIATNLITDFTNQPGIGGGGLPNGTQYLEIRCSGTTVKLFSNGTQVGADQTVADAQIVNNTIFGLFDTGGSTTNLFFLG